LNPGTTLIVIAIPFALIGAAFAAFGLKLRKRAARAKHWPAVTGQVTYVNMLTHTQSQEHRDNDGFKHASLRTTYEPVVRYAYSVEGSSHTSERICFGAVHFDQVTAYKMLNRYTNGADVNVFYDPEDPSEAVLEPHTPGGTTALFTGSLFILAGLGLFLSGLFY